MSGKGLIYNCYSGMAIRLATCGWQPPDMADRAMRAIRHLISGYFGALL
jgi:hypothetical protein